MTGIGLTLNIARQALAAQQYGLSVAGHNIANVNTPSYSRQRLSMEASIPVQLGSLSFGTGVLSQDVQQISNQMLENRLVDQKAELAKYEGAETYVSIMESYFNENSESSISSLMTDFWNAWQDLSNNPSGFTERGIVFEQGRLLTERLNSMDEDLIRMEELLTDEIDSLVNEVNSITVELASINQEVVRSEISGSANDQRDKRNALLTELGEHLDVHTFELDDGALSISTAGGYILVNGIDAYSLQVSGGQVVWEGSYGMTVDITGRISSGRLGGLLEMRDDVVKKYRTELDMFAEELIWAVNQQHSQGVGLNYFDEPVTGSYSAGETGLLDTLPYGDMIDYTQDFKMWIQDTSTVDTSYTASTVDMDFSTATASGWIGTAPEAERLKYVFTVTDSGSVDVDGEVALMDGPNMGVVVAGADAASVLDTAIADQTITVFGPAGEMQTISVADGGDAERSAASIAAALNSLNGVTASAFPNTVVLDISDILPTAGNGANPNDLVSFVLSSGSRTDTVSFRIGDFDFDTVANFQTALNNAIADIDNFRNDLRVDYSGNTATITSSSGENIGIADFDVEDLAVATLNNFTGLTTGTTVNFSVNGTAVTVDLAGVDTTDQTEIAQAFFTALDTSIPDAYITLSGDTVVITATDETASDFSFSAGSESDGSTDATFDIGLPGAVPASGIFAFDGSTTSFTSVDNVFDTILFDGETLTETGGAGNESAVKTGTATIILESGVTIQSNVASAAGSIFNQGPNAVAASGGTVLTLGGDGAYNGFDASNRISFYVDGTYVSYIVGAGDDTDREYAAGLESVLSAALDSSLYTVSLHGTHVSILKNDGTTIELTSFSDDDFGGGTAARLEVPPNDLLIADNSSYNSATSRYFGDRGVIEWEKFNDSGQSTGQRGTITISDEGTFEVDNGGLSFTISDGSLVAGNTFTLNTDTLGQADPLQLQTFGTANSVLDTYTFKVVSEDGGEIGADDIVVNWTNSVTSGSFTIYGETPPHTPVTVEVDGMRMQFESGTLFEGDVFTAFTDSSGYATPHLPSDWHWTMESFADQFNRQTLGVRAEVSNNYLTFSPETGGYEIDDIRFSGSDGFCAENCTIEVRNYGALDKAWSDFQIERNSTQYAATGGWNISGFTNPGYDVELVAMDGFSLDSGFYVELDGVRALAVTFSSPVSDDGSITFDIALDEGEYSFAFSDDDFEDSGLTAALGINTFFAGSDAMTIRMNSVLDQNRKYIAAAQIDGDTGEFSSGDNTNALAVNGVQHDSQDISQWSFEGGEDAQSTNLETTLGDYYNLMVGSLGIKAQSIKRGREFSEVMIDQISQLRDSVSAVSLDEEMINLMKFQHAFTVASKLLSISDEMMETLVSMR